MSDMEITQGATEELLFPVVDDNGDPMDLTTDFTDMCFVLTGKGTKITKEPGDTGFAITDSASTNDAMLITLEPDETAALHPGKLYTYEAWAEGADGKKRLTSGDCVVIKAEGCD